MKRGRFEGWYFRHQKEYNTIAFIPGSSASGAFIQMLTSDGTRYFKIPYISMEGDRICAGESVFSLKGCKINLPGVIGEIEYENLMPLVSDIMGPFRFLPMKCRHGIISMTHLLRGSITVNNKNYSFDGGKGYIEKDSGISFPSSYQWLQCNDFSEPCSLMISIARVPVYALHFTGCICAIIYHGQEYRLATYKGVKILKADENKIYLSQGDLLLKVDITFSDAGHSLKAPVIGRMTNTICERVNVKIHVKLWKHGQLLLSLHSPYAAYEYVPLYKNSSINSLVR